MIRIADLKDLDRLIEGNLALAQETEDLALDPKVLQTGVEAVLTGAEPGRYYVVEMEGEVVGQLMITFEWSDWRNRTVWWIQSVYVWPTHRGRGIYRQLYTHARDAAQAAGAAGIRLYVDQRNTRAQEVYTRLGMDGGHYQVFEAMFD